VTCAAVNPVTAVKSLSANLSLREDDKAILHSIQPHSLCFKNSNTMIIKCEERSDSTEVCKAV
jgi:hypothetical protein